MIHVRNFTKKLPPAVESIRFVGLSEETNKGRKKWEMVYTLRLFQRVKSYVDETEGFLEVTITY